MIPLLIVVSGEPLGKPRMTRRDKWKQRPCVMRYRAWADKILRATGLSDKIILSHPAVVKVKAYLPMPASWSEPRRRTRAGTPHTVKPDGDNIFKGVTDALIANDQFVFESVIEKRWDDGAGPRVEIYLS